MDSDLISDSNKRSNKNRIVAFDIPDHKDFDNLSEKLSNEIIEVPNGSSTDR